MDYQSLMDYLSKSGLIQGGAGALGGLMNLFGGGGKNPADAANKYYEKIPGQTQQYYQPYIDAGKNALDVNQGQYNNLINDPNSMLDKFGAGYKQSPGYKYNLEQAMAGVNNAAAAGGGLGTLGHQQLSADTTSGIASKDYQDYLKNVLGLYGTGLSGSQDIAHQGQNASQNYADILANVLSMQGQNAFAGQDAKNKSRGSAFSDIFSGIGSALPWLLNRR